MKVAFIIRDSLFRTRGGDTIQVLNTCKYLKRLAVEVDICLANEKVRYEAYDLLHFFNVIRPADILRHIAVTDLPFVVSTIFVEYHEFDRRYRDGIPGNLFRLLSANQVEYAKAIGRLVVSREKINSIEYLWRGHGRSVRKVIERSACLLPNSENEYRRLRDQIGIDKQYRVIPNGIDEELFLKTKGTATRDPHMVLCVGRIEGIKNQLTLIKALRNTRFQLYLVGSAAPHQQNYFEACREIATENIHFINHLPQSELVALYQKAKVHVLPGWFETTGLSSLEAAAMGCNLVITRKGDAFEYFGDGAFYCEPESADSIYKAVESASLAPLNDWLRKKIFSNFTWQKAASATLNAYNQVLNL